MSDVKAGARRGRKSKGAAREAEQTQTRRAILDAATRLFLRHGYRDFSLRQVAAAIGYTPTTIYLYFEDKDDLLFHVAMEGFRHFGAMLQAGYDAGATPLERLLALGRAYVRFGLDNPLHYRLMFIDRDEFLQREPPPGFEAPADSFGLLVRTVNECIAAGEIRPVDPEALAMAIWAAVHGVVSLALTSSGMDRAHVEAIAELTFSILAQGLRP